MFDEITGFVFWFALSAILAMSIMYLLGFFDKK